MSNERSLTGRIWRLEEASQECVLELAQKLGLPEIVARLLVARGQDVRSAPDFLKPRLMNSMPDPFHLKGVEEGAQRLVDAIESGEPIGLIGDYDADGATSTAMLSMFLNEFGSQCHIEIPDRLSDGYGPNTGALDRLAAQGCQLVLTLDTGTTAFEPLAKAEADGQDIIVVDHHQAEERLPPALAVINPNRMDQKSPLKALAAVGVTFILMVAVNALRRKRGLSNADPRRYLDLVATGTVCDVVPLLGLNRAFVHQGMKVAGRTQNLGLRALCEIAKIRRIEDPQQFGFALGPRINAGGRLGRSRLACQLLRTNDPTEAQSIAQVLDQLNRERQSLEQSYLKSARNQAEEQIEQDHRILILGDEGWHQGVVGIVASRIAELFHRPAFVIGWQDGVGKGSGRSIPGIDLGAMVIAARRDGLLLAGGGHEMAAGITIERSRISEFIRFSQEFVNKLPTLSQDEPPKLAIDAILSPGAANLGLVDKLSQLAPFGAGNPEPRFVLENAVLNHPRQVGRGHIACQVSGPLGGSLKAIAFRADDKALTPHLMRAGTPLRLAGRLRRNVFQGRESAQFEIEDVA